MKRLSKVLVSLGVMALILGGMSAPSSGSSSPYRALTTKPNIVLILTDDQRFDTLWAMPTVQSQLVQKGVRFTNGFVVNSTCCPSRASILKGQYSHSTLVYNSDPSPYGGFKRFDAKSTVATWLDAAGYRTGLFGKYANGYSGEGSSPVKPGWDRWFAFTSMGGGGGYYGFSANVDGTNTTFDSSHYSTDVLAQRAVSFIKSTAASQPLFLYLTPTAPHGAGDGKAPVPAARHRTAFSSLAPWRPPNYNEGAISDKPAYMRRLPLLSATAQASIDNYRRQQYRSLLAVDEAVRDVLRALSESGRLSNTLIVFASDNGFFWGEHRVAKQKLAPYEESIRVPYVVRYDRAISSSRTDQHPVLNIDLAPTFADAAGVGAPGTEGRSLLGLLSSPTAPWRESFLVERLQAESGWGAKIPTHCAVRSRDYLYVSYQTGERELYDLRSDPHQLRNVASDPEYALQVSALNTRMLQLCDPPPPGYTPTELGAPPPA